MKQDRDSRMLNRRRSGGRFLQPLALAGVCFVFVALLLTMAAMDFRTLDKTLVEYMEKRGVDFIRTVQQAAGFNLQQMNNTPEWDFDGDTSPGLEDQRLSLQESMVMAILQLAQRIDHDTGDEALDHQKLLSLTSRQGLWNLAFFNDRGGVMFQKRSVSNTIQKAVSNMIRDKKDLKIQIFEPVNRPISSRFLALRRKNNNGFVALVFDQQAFLFWKLRMAAEMAIETVGMPSNTDCFLIGDGSGLIIFQSGACSERSNEKASVSVDFMQQAEGSGGRVIWDGRKQLMMIERFSLGEGAPMIARLSLNTESLDKMIGKEKRWGIIAMGFMVFLAVLSMWFLYRNQNRHLTRMQQMERRLHQAERLSAMGRLASGVAHEIRNPLNAISMASQRLKKDNLQQLSPVIRNEIRRLNEIIEEFLGLSRGRQLKLERGDLVDLVRQVGLLMGEESRAGGVEIRINGAESCFMMLMDGNKIKQVLINLVKNAMESISGSGTVTIEFSAKENEMAIITISDTGTGLAEDDVEQIFNPDFTTKDQGLGLGLALAHEIIQAHGGEIRVRSLSGVGTTFDILLPVKDHMS
jgi:signal transduction histidine kinase